MTGLNIPAPSGAVFFVGDGIAISSALAVEQGKGLGLRSM
jgi:hypothetical protein